LIAFLVATFLLGPLQAEMTLRLDATRAGRQVVEQVTRCAADAAPSCPAAMVAARPFRARS
jgi:hypothetical protein